MVNVFGYEYENTVKNGLTRGWRGEGSAMIYNKMPGIKSTSPPFLLAPRINELYFHYYSCETEIVLFFASPFILPPRIFPLKAFFWRVGRKQGAGDFSFAYTFKIDSLSLSRILGETILNTFFQVGRRVVRGEGGKLFLFIRFFFF